MLLLVLGDDIGDAHKCKSPIVLLDSLMQDAKGFVDNFRSQVLGNHPCQAFKNMANDDLAVRLIHTLKAPDDCIDTYCYWLVIHVVTIIAFQIC